MLKKMKSKKGAALIEYGIIVGLISIVSISIISSLGGSITDVFTGVQSELVDKLP